MEIKIVIIIIIVVFNTIYTSSSFIDSVITLSKVFSVANPRFFTCFESGRAEVKWKFIL